MLFYSLPFLIFFPVVTLAYYLLPKQFRPAWLLGASYYFYFCWNPRYLVLLIGTTLLSWLAGLEIGKAAGNKKRCFGISLTLVLGVLFFFKYTNFFLGSLGSAMRAAGLHWQPPVLSILLPVGISFYTFQVVGYLIDVYRGTQPPETNLLHYALFVGFFPQLLSGPIERSGNMLPQWRQTQPFQLQRVQFGLQLMLWGYFEKLVIADRAATFVNNVFDHYGAYGGFTLAAAVVLYALQMYADFSGYSHIAIGAAEVLGIRIMANFRQPYFATTISEFWSRWHISLSSWLQDYVFTPLSISLSRRMRALPKEQRRKWKKLPSYVGLMVTFLVSGLWHGAAWTFVVWGALHGLYHVIGGMTLKSRTSLAKKLGVDCTSASHRMLQRLAVFAMVCFGYIFFYSSSLGMAFTIIRNLFSAFNPWVFTDGTLYTFGLDEAAFRTLWLATGVLLAVDIAHEKGIALRAWLAKQGLWLRWLVLFGGLFWVILYGVYGSAADSSRFLYLQF